MTPTPIFSEILGHDPAGRIIGQTSRHGTAAADVERYRYDSTSRLIQWIRNTDTVNWSWDGLDNRLSEVKRDPLLGVVSDSYFHGAGGTNRLSDVVSQTSGGAITGVRSFSYNANGSAVAREHRASLGGPIVAEEHLAYSYRELTRQFIDGAPASLARQDWRYRYSPGGEREQKRLYYGPAGDENGNVYPWVYYQLGGSKEQIAVYHGQQTQGTLCTDSARAVYFYPSEYLVHSQADATTKEALSRVRVLPNGRREYRVADQIGSLRASIDLTGSEQHYDYAPFGELVWSSAGTASDRLGFNDNEKDRESGDLSLGARHMVAKDGGFQSVDPLWRQEPGKSPYHYVSGDPLRFVDPTGLQKTVVYLPYWQDGSIGVPNGGVSIYEAAWARAMISGTTIDAELMSSTQRLGGEARAAQAGGAAAQEARTAATTAESAATEATAEARQLTPRERLAQNAKNGAAGEAATRAESGGQKPGRVTTEKGARYYDNKTPDGVYQESKVGETSANTRVMLQASKDALVVKNGTPVQWVFRPSPVTSKVGPTEPLRNFLMQMGIEIKMP